MPPLNKIVDLKELILKRKLVATISSQASAAFTRAGRVRRYSVWLVDNVIAPKRNEHEAHNCLTVLTCRGG